MSKARLFIAAFAIACALGVVVRSAQSGPTLSALEKARTDAASKAYAAYEAQQIVGTATAESVYVWSVRWLEAEGGPTKSAAADEHRKRMVSLENNVAAKLKAGVSSNAELAAVQYYRAEAEVWAARAKGGKP